MDNLMNTLGQQSRSAAQQLGQLETTQKAVSYTHLTLPTNSLV